MSENIKGEKLIALNFAKNSVSTKQPSYRLPSKVSKSSIISYIENPYTNANKLQEVSIFLKYNNGVYNRLLKYYGNMLTFDHILYPIEIDSNKKSGNNDKLLKAYNETALYLERLNVKYTFNWWYQKLLECGELYVFKLDDKDGVVWKEMPNSMCRISGYENGVSRFSIDLNKVQNQDVYDTMPTDIQKIVDKFKNGSIKKEDLKDNSWFELTENAYAFNIISPYVSKGFPPFSYLFDGLMYIDSMKQLQSENAENENLKIIHQKVPMNKETGELLIDYELIQEYHDATKRNLPKGIAITTNPLDVEGITLMKSGAQFVNQRTEALNSLYDDAGVNSELFNGDSKNTESIASGIKVDEMLTFEVLGMFENFLNYEISQNIKSSFWRVKMLNTTHFSKEREIKLARENLAFGGSRFHALGVNGFTPLQSLNILKGEQALGIDTIMIPAQSSHTTANVGGQQGRPKQDANTPSNDTKNTNQPNDNNK